MVWESAYRQPPPWAARSRKICFAWVPEHYKTTAGTQPGSESRDSELPALASAVEAYPVCCAVGVWRWPTFSLAAEYCLQNQITPTREPESLPARARLRQLVSSSRLAYLNRPVASLLFLNCVCAGALEVSRHA